MNGNAPKGNGGITQKIHNDKISYVFGFCPPNAFTGWRVEILNSSFLQVSNESGFHHSAPALKFIFNKNKYMKI